MYRGHELIALREHNHRLLAKINGTRTVAELCDGLDQAATLNTMAELWRLDVIAVAQQRKSTR